MKNYLTLQRQTLVDIADAVRIKKGIEGNIAISDLDDEILSIIGQGAGNGVLEQGTLIASAWTEVADVEPFTHSQTINLTDLSNTSISIELINDNATLFSTYGFSIASVSGASVVIYSIEAPTEDVTLTFEVVNPVD